MSHTYDVDAQQEQRITDLQLRDATKLLPVPTVLQEALSQLNDDADSRFGEVASILGRDEVITAKLLRVVNSGFYGLPGRVRTVSQALALLGIHQVRMLVLGLALLEAVSVRHPLAAANRKAVWRHSFACARLAQAIAKLRRYPAAEEAFVGGLLHDVGKVALAVAAPREFAASLVLAREQKVDSCQAERVTVGANHVVAGILLAGQWRFPAVFQSVIAHHHEQWPPSVERHTDAASLKHLLAILRVANVASRELPSVPMSVDGFPVGGAGGPVDPVTLRALTDQVDSLLLSSASNS